MAISYEANEWKDGESGGTPITAARLNSMEAGILAACDGVDSVDSSISTLQSGLSTANGNISTLQSGLSTANSNISSLQSTVGNIDSQISSAVESALTPTSVSLSPNTSLLNYSSYTNSSVKIGNLLILQASIILSTSTNWTSDELRLFTIGTSSAIPSAERTIYRMCIVASDAGDACSIRGLRVDTSGRVYFVNNSTGTSGINIVIIPGIAVRL